MAQYQSKRVGGLCSVAVFNGRGGGRAERSTFAAAMLLAACTSSTLQQQVEESCVSTELQLV